MDSFDFMEQELADVGREMPKEDKLRDMGLELLAQFPPLDEKLRKSFKEPHEALVETIKFLFLVAKAKAPLSPSILVDEAWHEFILCTRLYHSFCEKHFGRYIHHTPSLSTDQKKNPIQFFKTLHWYFIYFGEPAVEMWGNGALEEWKTSQCGTCNAN